MAAADRSSAAPAQLDTDTDTARSHPHALGLNTSAKSNVLKAWRRAAQCRWASPAGQRSGHQPFPKTERMWNCRECIFSGSAISYELAPHESTRGKGSVPHPAEATAGHRHQRRSSAPSPHPARVQPLSKGTAGTALMGVSALAPAGRWVAKTARSQPCCSFLPIPSLPVFPSFMCSSFSCLLCCLGVFQDIFSSGSAYQRGKGMDD